MRLTVVCLAALVLVGCNSDEKSTPPAPAATADVRLLDGGRDAFEAYVKEQGRPTVVNKWASWCGPCRAEFPYFGSQAKKLKGKVAFVGVNSDDNDANAREFLGQFPVPFPSFKDPDLKIAASFNGVQSFPATAYYDRKGDLAYLHQGAYLKESDLVDDIDKYAR